MWLFIALSAPALAERALPVTELPAAVQAAIAARWPGAELLEAEREWGRFEVLIRAADGQSLEVELTRRGDIREVETEEEGEESERDSSEHGEEIAPVGRAMLL